MPVRSRPAHPRRWPLAASLRLAAALLLAACGGAGAGAGPTTAAPDPGSVTAEVDDAARAVLAVEVEACGGGTRNRATGVALADRLVVTVAHTFERAAGFELSDHRGRLRGARLVWLDPGRDLAVLRLDDPAPGQLPLGEAPDGSPVRILTRAGDSGPEVKQGVLVRHVVVTLDGEGRRAALELDADIEPGDSGSPVLNPAGEVVGLVFAASRPGAGPLTVDGNGVGVDGVPPTGDVPAPTEPARDQSWAVDASELASALRAAGTEPVAMAC